MRPTTLPPRVHGGADASGPLPWDFSTCANAAGPCPAALEAVQQADLSRYPDPTATAVRQALAALHGVAPWRILPAASASEFIQRLTAVTGRRWPGPVCVPAHAYGDYATAARAWGRRVIMEGQPGALLATLGWTTEPSSPQGQDAPPPPDPGRAPWVLDAVYAPLRLQGRSAWSEAERDRVFVLHSPNKALGLTGLRGAYAVAPAGADYDLQACCEALEAAAPSWPLSAPAEAMLRAWARPQVQAWVQASLPRLADWRGQLLDALERRGFRVWPGVAPHSLVQPPAPVDLAMLRARGIAVRDTHSFGLPGAWRLAALPPAAQRALLAALDESAA